MVSNEGRDYLSIYLYHPSVSLKREEGGRVFKNAHTHMTHQNSNFKKEKKNALFSIQGGFFLSSRARINKAYIQTHRSSSSSSLCKLPPRVSERRPRLGSTRLWRIFEWDHRLCLPTFASEFVLKTSPHRSLLPLPQFVEIVVRIGVVSVLVLVVVARQKPPFPNIRRKGRPSFLRSCCYSCWLISSCTSSLSSRLSS